MRVLTSTAVLLSSSSLPDGFLLRDTGDRGLILTFSRFMLEFNLSIENFSPLVRKRISGLNPPRDNIIFEGKNRGGEEKNPVTWNRSES